MLFAGSSAGLPPGTFAMPLPIFNLFGLDAHGGGGADAPGDFDQLLHQLFVSSQARGTPPAAKSAVETLRRGAVTQEMVAAADACAVCQEPFAAGEVVTFMPCTPKNHAFHTDCLMPWLQIHNSCPSCRAELPTDDPDYEARQAHHHRR
jgi:E3 ubiquitin-protein ligase RNF115/126